MQTKTIQKTIANKLTEWLSTITDEKLRIDLKNNVLVSGGSITSLFLNQDVNDFDIYIKDWNVLVRLTEYYTKPYDNITILKGTDKEKLTATLSEKYGNSEMSEIDNAYSIALRTLKPDQLKLFFFAKNGGLKVNEDKADEQLNYEPKFFSPNAISLSNKIQIVIRFHGDDKAIHKTFDYIHATNYFTFESGLVTNIAALESILCKQLKYQGSLYPITSVIRMKKFIQRGWNINAGEILKILFQVSELNLRDADVLEEQLIGVDVAYFDKLIEILRGVKPENMQSQYLNAIIDKVFGDSEEII